MEKSLHNYFLSNTGKVIHKWVHYFDIYEKHFRPYVETPILVFEIGVSKGGSLNMWKSYFHKDTTIVGIDINSSCKQHEDINNKKFVEIGHQSDINFLASLIDKYGKPNIVIDDGSHLMEDLINTFNFLYYNMDENGTYLAEDLHTAYWEGYGGGYKNPNSFIEFTKNKIDELHHTYTDSLIQASEFAYQTDSISFYDSIIVFEKKPQAARQDIQMGRF